MEGVNLRLQVLPDVIERARVAMLELNFEIVQEETSIGLVIPTTRHCHDENWDVSAGCLPQLDEAPWPREVA